MINKTDWIHLYGGSKIHQIFYYISSYNFDRMAHKTVSLQTSYNPLQFEKNFKKRNVKWDSRTVAEKPVVNLHVPLHSLQKLMSALINQTLASYQTTNLS